jgi:hypothetical protein
MGTATRWVRWIAAGSVAAAMLGGTLAWASSGPKFGDYFSTSPSVEIFVQKGAKSVTLYTSCGPVTELTASWDSPGKVPLHNGSFSFDKQTTVDKIQDHPTFTSTPVKATVLFTGTFKDGKFKGKVHLGGSTCGEASYTAHFSDHGGGQAG